MGEQREITVTPEMLRAGVRAYFSWNQEGEEGEAMVAAVFFAMIRELGAIHSLG